MESCVENDSKHKDALETIHLTASGHHILIKTYKNKT